MIVFFMNRSFIQGLLIFFCFKISIWLMKIFFISGILKFIGQGILKLEFIHQTSGGRLVQKKSVAEINESRKLTTHFPILQKKYMGDLQIKKQPKTYDAVIVG